MILLLETLDWKMTESTTDAEETEEERAEQLRRSCEAAFEEIVGELQRTTPLERPLHRLDLFIDLAPSFNALVGRPRGSQDVTIEVCDGLIQDNFAFLDEYHLAFKGAVLSPLRRQDDDLLELALDPLLGTLYELGIQFVLHHELFHLLCGHLDLVASETVGDRVEIDEGLVYLAAAGRPVSDSDLVRSYYLELEADALALEWLLDRLSFTSIDQQLDTLGLGPATDGDWTISDLQGDSRILGFRFVTAAVWAVVLQIEANRRKAGPERFRSHPLPAARLIALTKTLMGWYCRVESLRVSETGALLWKPQPKDLEPIKEFWRSVMLPAFEFVTNLPNVTTPHTASPTATDSSEFSARSVLQDIKDLLGQRAPQGPGGRQLAQIERLRMEMARELSELRYLDVLNTGMTGR